MTDQVGRMAWGLVGLAAVLAASSAARADGYKDEKLGFSLTAPKKWKQMPVASDERWIVAKFQSTRIFEASDPKVTWWVRHTPFLDVVIIPLDAEEQTPSVEKTGDGVKVKLPQPWSDMKEYLDKSLQKNAEFGFQEGGFYFSKEEETQIDGQKVMQYEITMDKAVQTPKRIYAWAYYTKDAIYGLMGDALIQFEDKVKPDLVAAFRSFKAFPRTGTLPGAQGGEVTIKTDGKGEDLSDADLKKRRDEATNTALGKIKSNLPDGWSVKDGDHFVAVSHADAKYTKQVLEHAEALRAWLEENLGYIGNGYAGKIIVRICADREERDAFSKTDSWSPAKLEVTTYKDKDGWGEWAMSSLNSGIYSIWGRDKNLKLAWGLPSWLSYGLSQVVDSATTKGKKVEFKPDIWDSVKMAELRRADRLIASRTFFSMDTEALFPQSRGPNDQENWRQAQFFVRYLLLGAATKNAKYKNVLSDYIKNLVFLLDEADVRKADEKEPQNEQEEDALFRAHQEAWKKAEKERLDKLLEKTFQNWDTKEWDRFTASYWKELGV